MQNGTNAMQGTGTGHAGIAISADDFARSLTLVRASAMNVLRLQLAVERQDRRTMLQTVDELVAIDSQLRDVVSDIPARDEEVADMGRQLEAQRSAIAREKLALVGGISLRGRDTASNQMPALPLTRAADETGAATICAPPPEIDEAYCEETNVQSASRGRTFLVGILFLVLAFVAAALIFGPAGGWQQVQSLIQ